MATREGTNITVNIPDILMSHARRAVEEKKLAVSAYSMGDLIRDALRGLLTPDASIYKDNSLANAHVGPVVTAWRGGPHDPELRKISAADLAAKFGIKTGATIEEVEPGFPGSLGPDAGQELVVGASEEQTEDPSLSFIKEFGREALIRGTKIRGWGKMSWEQRFDLAREQKDASGT